MSQGGNESDWNFTERPDGANLVVVGDKRYPTNYSRRIVELLVARKGVERMPRYLSYRDERSAKLEPLFDALRGEGRGISVLEPGCSSGHLSEAILSYPFVKRLVSFDTDAGMIEVCREKKSHFGFGRWEPVCAKTPSFTGETFDVVLLSAMMEHVDAKLRAALVESCYERLAPGGLFVVLESQNRLWPFEYHVIRLPIPYAHFLPPRVIYRLCRLSGRYPETWSFEEFANPNTGWWGTAYGELLPKSASVSDVSEKYGFGSVRYESLWKTQGPIGGFKLLAFRVLAAAASLFGVPHSALFPALYVVFRKEES